MIRPINDYKVKHAFMSEKISINVEILGINTSHNFMVPNDMNISKMTSLILKTLEDEYLGVECSKMSNHLLIQASTGKALATNCGLSQLGIINGEKLILM